MKKSVKKCLVGLVAVPMAVMLVGCGKTEVKAPFDSNPYAISGRTYSNQTEITSTDVYTNNMAAPVFTTSTDASVASVANTKGGGKTVVINNVTEADYTSYEARVNPEEGEGASFQTAEVLPGEYVVTFDDGEVVDGVGTMTIDYTPEEADRVAAPSSFKTLNLAAGAQQNLYFKYIVDSSTMYNMMVEMTLLMGGGQLDREMVVEMLATEGITEDNCAMSLEMAKRGEDYAMGMYLDMYDMQIIASKVGNTLYVTEKGPASMLLEDDESDKIAKVWYKQTYEAGATDDMTGQFDFNLGFVEDEDTYTLDDLLSMYASTGYEMIDGKSYYYEEFTFPAEEPLPGEDPEEPSVVRYYFNGDDLVFAESDGMMMEIIISNTIPARLFETKCPTGYINYTGKVEE